MRELLEQTLLEQGCTVDCDKCKKLSRVERIDTAPRVTLKQHHK